LIWDTESWKLMRTLDDPNELIFGVAWSADAERLVSAGSDGILRWWNPHSGQCIRAREGHEGPIQSLRAVLTVAFSPVAGMMERS
jgi:WD40 repeat protein